MAAGAHRHRAGSLRQVNKRNKRSSASKRSKTRNAGGKVEGGGRASLKGRSGTHCKADRAHMAKQRREASRKRALEQRRGMGAKKSTNVPRVIGIVSLSEKEDELEEAVRRFLVDGSNRVVVPADGGSSEEVSSSSSVTAEFDLHKRDFGSLTFLTSSSAFGGGTEVEDANLNDDEDDEEDHPDEVERKRVEKEDKSIEAALDMCRVCDLVLFLMDGEQEEGGNKDGLPLEVATDARSTTVAGRTAITNRTTGTARYDYLISSRGDRVLTALKAQGLPTPVALLVHPHGTATATTATCAANADTATFATATPFGAAAGKDDDDGDTFNVEFQDVDDAMSLGASTVKSLKSIRRTASRRRMEMRRFVSRFATTEFGTDAARTAELYLCADDDDAAHPTDASAVATAVSALTHHPTRTALLRLLCTISASPPRWVAEMPRPYLLTDGGCREEYGYRYDTKTKELSLSGYIRGSAPWDVHSLIHLPHLGTFGVKKICKAVAPSERTKCQARPVKGKATEDACVVFADPMKRESLDMFATPDALMGEQNLVGFDEEKERSDNHDGEQQAKGEARPAGWSDYQSAWLEAMPKEELEGDNVDYGELARELNQRRPKGGDKDDMEEDDDDANEVSPQERAALLERRRKDQKDETDFPDEVQVPEDVNARDRFARYRSLKSFRRSFWDPKENLPESYATIYHFSSFRSTQRDVLADARDVVRAASAVGGQWEWWGRGGDQEEELQGRSENDMEEEEKEEEKEKERDKCLEILEGYVPVGTFVRLTVEGVSEEAIKQFQSKFGQCCLLVGVSLLAHENKVSVLHAGLSPSGELSEAGGPVKSKDVLTFRVGWRTWRGRPVISQHNLNCDKHKMERFLPSCGFFAASVFGAVTWSPSPVLVFRQANATGQSCSGGSNMRELVAHGSVLGADADRIVVKRIVLTGYPVKVQKRHATVKYMFYNPDDVRWFKPAGLTTKHGLQGTIEESVGEHGTMKCLFNAPIQQHDTVCLPLYKRIYPKYAPLEKEEDSGDETTRSRTLVVW